MNSNLHDWINLLLRWFHFVAGIMWIGTSFYFVWLDSSFKSTPESKKGVDGEVWMVHGGNFYHVQKRRFGPGEMPPLLHWFKWEATLTWLSGFFLLLVVYYLTNGIYLIDPQIKALTPTQAHLIGLAVVFGGWFFYDLLFRSPLAISLEKISLAKISLLNYIGLFLIIFLIYFLTHTFSGRGAFIHLGAMFGTIMVLNVWVHILPNQKAIIEASNAGKEPDYELGKKAKTRSMHNSYMTMPVLFIMISNHFPATFGHSQNWIVLLLITLMGALIRHSMIHLRSWPLIPSFTCLGILIFMTGSNTSKFIISSPSTPTSSHFFQVNHIIQVRCVQCHSLFPTDDVFKTAPNGVNFDTTSDIQRWKERIKERVVVQKTMPLANKTLMTDDERIILEKWFEQGVKNENSSGF